jgi:arsenite methyltransferase
MQRVLDAWDKHLVHRSLPRTLAPALRSAGFDHIEMETHSFATAEFHPDTYGAANVALISRFVAGQDGVTADEAKRWADEQRELGQRGEFYFACLQFCFKGIRPG